MVRKRGFRGSCGPHGPLPDLAGLGANAGIDKDHPHGAADGLGQFRSDLVDRQDRYIEIARHSVGIGKHPAQALRNQETCGIVAAKWIAVADD